MALNTKVNALQRERDTLLSERDFLKETCEELQCESSVKTGNLILLIVFLIHIITDNYNI